MNLFFRILLAIAFLICSALPLRAETYDGANMSYLGQVFLFENSSNDNRISVNNTTTFAGGWLPTMGPTVVFPSTNNSAGKISLRPAGPSGPNSARPAGPPAPSSATSGSGTVVLSGSNTYSGGTTLNVGPVVVTHPSALGDDSGVIDFHSTYSSGETVIVIPPPPVNDILISAGATLNNDILLPNLLGSGVILNFGVSDDNFPLVQFTEPVPEPSSLVLAGGGLAILAAIRLRRKSRRS